MRKEDSFIMKPKVDYCFKEIMKNPNVRKGFIGDLLEVDPESIVNTKLLPTIQERKRSDDKYCILDVLVEMEDGTELDFEIQLDYDEGWDKRSIYYLSEMIVGQLRSGEDYTEIKKCIHVSILDFELFSGYNEFYTKFHLWDDNFKLKYSDILEIHVIELKKLKKYIQKEGEILNWAKFFNSESKEEFREAAKGNKYIEEAYMDVLKLSENEEKRYEYRARERALKDKTHFLNAAKRAEKEGMKQGLERGIAKGLEQGLAQGLEQGLAQGLEQGLAQGRYELIKNALEKGRKPEDIAEFNGISLEEVVEVQKNIENK